MADNRSVGIMRTLIHTGRTFRKYSEDQFKYFPYEKGEQGEGQLYIFYVQGSLYELLRSNKSNLHRFCYTMSSYELASVINNLSLSLISPASDIRGSSSISTIARCIDTKKSAIECRIKERILNCSNHLQGRRRRC